MPAAIVENLDLSPRHPEHFRLTLEAPWIAEHASPGQFIHVLPPGRQDMLRRPFSIMTASAPTGRIHVIYRVVGEGTALLASSKSGDKLDVIGPLGNGFPIDAGHPAVLVGGGLGIPPLVFLANELGKPRVFLGAKDAGTLVCAEYFRELEIETCLATEDGSVGFEGIVTEAIADLNDFDEESVVYACGPIPMLKTVGEWSADSGFKCYVSLENKVGCGIGICLGCSIPIREEDGSIHYERVCCDGPVFDASRVAFDLM